MEFFEIIVVIASLIVILFIGYLIGKYITLKHFDDKIPKEREDAIKQSRAVLSGQFSEQIAPYLPDFPFKPTEARFIGKPIDFLVFKGADEKNIDEVIFVEVKSGKASLSTHERKLKDVIKAKKVSWQEYRIPEDLTKKKED